MQNTILERLLTLQCLIKQSQTERRRDIALEGAQRREQLFPAQLMRRHLLHSERVKLGSPFGVRIHAPGLLHLHACACEEQTSLVPSRCLRSAKTERVLDPSKCQIDCQWKEHACQHTCAQVGSSPHTAGHLHATMFAVHSNIDSISFSITHTESAGALARSIFRVCRNHRKHLR